MTDVRQLLTTGERGVRWTPPEGTVVRESDRVLAVRDAAGLGWQIALWPMPFACEPAEEKELAIDLAISARDSYLQAWHARPRLDVGAQPRTVDPAWSPLIEVRVATSGPARLLRVVRHLDDDVVVGHVIVPLADGHFEARVSAKGDRPITRVQEALETTALALEIALPAVRTAEVVLDDAKCAFTPPPRFVGFGGMQSGVRGFYRAGLDGWRRLLDVWRVGTLQQNQLDPRPAMAEQADRIVAAWEKEGMTEVQTQCAFRDAFGNRPMIEQYVRFRIDGAPSHTLHRWWLEPDSTLFRIGSNGPPSLPQQLLRGDLDQVQQTWRGL